MRPRTCCNAENPAPGFRMKKPKSKTTSAKTPADAWTPFPEKVEDWTDEDRALALLLQGLRVSLRFAGNSEPFPPMLYVPVMTRFFQWIASEISERENQDAADRL